MHATIALAIGLCTLSAGPEDTYNSQRPAARSVSAVRRQEQPADAYLARQQYPFATAYQRWPQIPPYLHDHPAYHFYRHPVFHHPLYHHPAYHEPFYPPQIHHPQGEPLGEYWNPTRRTHGTGDLFPHIEYYPQYHGHYAFRPNNYEGLMLLGYISQRLGGDRRNPLDNRFVVRIFEKLGHGTEDIALPEPESSKTPPEEPAPPTPTPTPTPEDNSGSPAFPQEDADVPPQDRQPGSESPAPVAGSAPASEDRAPVPAEPPAAPLPQPKPVPKLRLSLDRPDEQPQPTQFEGQPQSYRTLEVVRQEPPASVRIAGPAAMPPQAAPLRPVLAIPATAPAGPARENAASPAAGHQSLDDWIGLDRPQQDQPRRPSEPSQAQAASPIRQMSYVEVEPQVGQTAARPNRVVPRLQSPDTAPASTYRWFIGQPK